MAKSARSLAANRSAMRAVDEALIMAVLTIAIVVGVLTAGPFRGASSLPDNGRMSAGGQIK